MRVPPHPPPHPPSPPPAHPHPPTPQPDHPPPTTKKNTPIPKPHTTPEQTTQNTHQTPRTDVLIPDRGAPGVPISGEVAPHLQFSTRLRQGSQHVPGRTRLSEPVPAGDGARDPTSRSASSTASSSQTDLGSRLWTLIRLPKSKAPAADLAFASPLQADAHDIRTDVLDAEKPVSGSSQGHRREFHCCMMPGRWAARTSRAPRPSTLQVGAHAARGNNLINSMTNAIMS